MTSILDYDNNEPSRPYSQTELKNILNNFYRKMRLGKTIACHKNCGHWYLVKKNGEKEKKIKLSKNFDSGSCSVCWKYNRTPVYLRNKLSNIVYIHDKFLHKLSISRISLSDIQTEIRYYIWLYNEFNN